MENDELNEEERVQDEIDQQDQELEEEMEEEGRSIRLAKARALEYTKKIVEEKAKEVAKKLNLIIENGYATTGFSIVIIAALFKDFILDLFTTALTAIPYVGWLIAPIPGIFIGVGLAYFLWGKGTFLKFKLRIIWGIFVDYLPLISAMPITTFVVLWSWKIVRDRAAKAREKLRKLHDLTDKEIEDLDRDITLLDNEPAPRFFAERRTEKRTNHQAALRAQLLSANERRQRIEALQKKRGYANLNLHAGTFERKYKYNDDIK